jgi:hypothetical protein
MLTNRQTQTRVPMPATGQAHPKTIPNPLHTNPAIQPSLKANRHADE